MIYNLFFDIIIFMGQKKYSIIIILTTILAWLAFFMVINNFDPFKIDLLIFTLFYLTLFLSIFGTFSLLLFYIHKISLASNHKEWNIKNKKEKIMITESFRKSILISLIFIVALILQSERLLTWWNTILLVIIFSMFEFVILAFKKEKK